MTLESYQLSLAPQGIAVLDLGDSPDQSARFDAIAQLLRHLGATPITTHTFMLPADGRCTVATLQSLLGDLISAGDQLLVVADSDQGITCTALISPNTTEGVTLNK